MNLVRERFGGGTFLFHFGTTQPFFPPSPAGNFDFGLACSRLSDGREIRGIMWDVQVDILTFILAGKAWGNTTKEIILRLSNE